MTAVLRYRKRPITVEAKQWTGDNLEELWDWIGADGLYGPLPIGDPLRPFGQPARLYVAANDAWLDLEIGEWIIRDSKGFYPCKHDIFEVTYEPVKDPS